MSAKLDPGPLVAASGVVATVPWLGDYALIVVVALIGALAALSRREDLTRMAAMRFIFRSVAIASVLSGLTALIISEQTGRPYYQILAPVAFTLAWAADRFPAIVDKALDWVQGRMGIK